VFGLQKQELFDHQEQKEDYRSFGTEEVLSSLPAPHDAPGSEVTPGRLEIKVAGCDHLVGAAGRGQHSGNFLVSFDRPVVSHGRIGV